MDISQLQVSLREIQDEVEKSDQKISKLNSTLDDLRSKGNLPESEMLLNIIIACEVRGINKGKAQELETLIDYMKSNKEADTGWFAEVMV